MRTIDAPNLAPPAFLPRHLVPHLPPTLSDAETIDPQNYGLMQIEDISHEQDERSYRLLVRMRDDWHGRGRTMTLIQWRDGTQGVQCGEADQPPTDADLLRVYRMARSKRELFEADGGRA
ncbi:hypothetical protein [Sulfuritalea hydrogenivorans]|uniref:Uncharacterized protein n=1 Tax=Sulfuritalea hydrogenivorans sk43H TaxID=1223802 RepID=W0SDU2_9PROT|nr:hypothetical protein [Sulfuritalea hydrogenivorans]BAO29379.1 hypothetical protein SUTH_01586 [Sulfuritalea hydrogenivorans sk43H]